MPLYDRLRAGFAELAYRPPTAARPLFPCVSIDQRNSALGPTEPPGAASTFAQYLPGGGACEQANQASKDADELLGAATSQQRKRGHAARLDPQ